MCLNNTSEVIRKMKKEHGKYLISLQFEDDQEQRSSLTDWIARGIEKPERGKGYAFCCLKNVKSLSSIALIGAVSYPGKKISIYHSSFIHQISTMSSSFIIRPPYDLSISDFFMVIQQFF